MSSLNAYQNWINLKDKDDKNWCKTKFLSRGALTTIADLKRQFAEQLSEIGFLNKGLTMRDMQKVKKGK